MNYLIDFDHTLYNTPLLTKDMLSILAKYISKNSQLDFNNILEELTNKFKRDGIYDIYELISFFAQKYHFNEADATNAVNKVIYNGKKYLFNDAVPFLSALKKEGHKIYILSYNEKELYFQTVKIAGSGLLKYVDGLMTITTLKGELPLDFSQCIFVDDKPKDLISIHHKKPLKIYRIRRKNDTYSHIETNLDIPEFDSLSDLHKKNFPDKNIGER